MTNIIYIGIFIISVALIVGILILIEESYKKLKIKETLKRLGESGVQKTKTNENNKIVYLGATISVILSISLFWGSRFMVLGTMIFLVLSIILIKYFIHLQENRIERQRRKEVGILFECIEIFLKAGMSLNKALTESREMLNYLEPAVAQSCAYWPDEKRVLENLKKEINLPEADILVSLLSQINLVGINQFEGVIQRETKRMESIKNAREKVETDKKPYILIFSSIIPIVVILSMFVGSLFVRMMDIMQVFSK